MKLNYGTIDTLFGMLNRMSGLTGKAGFIIAKAKTALGPDAAVFNEVKENLIRKYGEPDKDGIIVKPGGSKWTDFIRELSELCNRQVEIELVQLPRSEYDIDKIYCEKAAAIDYELFEAYMVERDEPDRSVSN